MLMADTMAIFFVILGLLLALPGLWVLCRGLWPRAVAKAAAVCGEGLIKPFLAGLPLTAVMIFAAAVLGNFGPAGKIAAVATVCLYLMIANCGVAGLVTVVGERLAGPSGNIDPQQPWRATLRGGVALGLASLLPILGWFVILPAAVIIGCGANLLSLLRTLAASRVRSGQALASPVETSELRATPTRREWMKVAVVAGGALSASPALVGCERVISRVTKEFGQTIPERVSVAGGSEIDPSFHLLSRASYGVWPGDLDRVRAMTAEAWIEEQLAPEKIDDALCDLRARRFETLHHEPGTCYEYKKSVLREEITRHTLLRAVYSRRQLFEVMVEFWTDHLNINLEKGDSIYLKPSDDRLVIHAHALGKFRDLIRASALSPAMLVYLDGKENRKAGPEDIPNENYARELLELHTLGVNGGYTQADVYEVARCLTGWRLRTKWRKGTVYFEPAWHDDGEKTVLGYRIPAGGGERDLDRVVEIVCDHPSTA